MTAQNVVAFKMLKLGQLQDVQNWADDQTEHNSHTMFTWSLGGEADLGRRLAGARELAERPLAQVHARAATTCASIACSSRSMR